MLANNTDYIELLEQIKHEIVQTRSQVASQAGTSVIGMYWRIGGHLNKERGYGTGYIDSLSKDIRTAFTGIKGMSARNLRYMAKFAREVDAEFCNGYCKIPWGHIVKLLDKTEPGERREWYRLATIENGWSQVVLDHQIDMRLYERQVLSGNVSNFSRTLPDPQSELAQQQLKDPYLFDFITARQSYVEHDIEEQMIQNVTSTLLELGTGFAFVGRQYHLEVGDTDFYIDLLFYNLNLRCYVVIELKNEDFKPEFTGKLAFYVTAVDETLGSKHEFFHEWKRLAEGMPGLVDLETMLRGMCGKRAFMDLFENFILFDHSGPTVAKILARNHQYLGVFWHTQGSGKSYSMVFLARKIKRKFAGCGCMPATDAAKNRRDSEGTASPGRVRPNRLSAEARWRVQR